MIVGGIVIRTYTGDWHTVDQPRASLMTIQMGDGDTGSTTESGVVAITDPGVTDPDPRPFILVGGLPAIFGSTIISHFLASEWGQRLLYGSEEDQMTYEIEQTR